MARESEEVLGSRQYYDQRLLYYGIIKLFHEDLQLPSAELHHALMILAPPSLSLLM